MATSSAPSRPIRIIGLFAENVKMLRLADLTPNSHVNRITGANASGKSSLIESMSYGLTSARSHPPQMIRTGEDRMTIRIELGDTGGLVFTVIRRATADGDTDLTLEAANGTVLKKPQDILDGIRASSGFEPIAFLRMDAKAQMETFRRIVDVDVDLDFIDSEILKLMEERRLHRPTIGPLNDRAIKLAPELDSEMDVSPVDTTVLLDTIQRSAAHNATLTKEQQRRSEQADRARDNRVQAEHLRKQAQVLLEQADGLDNIAAGIETGLQYAPQIGQPTDIAALRLELSKMEADRRARENQLRVREEYAQAFGDHKKAVAREEALTLAIEEERRKKREAIARAKMPVEGLSWDDNGVTFRDLPFVQASQAEQIRVAVGIWIAQNPILRIISVRDASLLDEDSLALLEQMAEEHDFQVWLEIVSKEPGPIGVHMRAGEVYAIDGVPKLALK